MLISMQWLKQYVDVPDDYDIDNLAHQLVMAGTEVEEIRIQGKDFQKVTAGRIQSIDRHPNADRLLVCQIDMGDQLIQVVTGASNISVGMIVPVALAGATLAHGVKISKGKLRGVESFGMLCSGQELGLKADDYPGADIDGIMPLPPDTPLGNDVKDVIGLHDIILDIKAFANRPDCMSVQGVAREVAAILNLPFHLPVIKVKQAGAPIAQAAHVQVQDPVLCPRFMLRLVRDVKIAPSPQWLCTAIRAAGMRPVNNIVDITNYVMLEMGQPLHAYDLRDIHDGTIIVRRARPGEQMDTLDGKSHVLNEEQLVIADQQGAVGIAGIMGGLNSEIRPDTSSILLESAMFKGSNVRTTSRALGIITEASSRFAKGIDIAGVSAALDRAAQLIEELNCGTVASGVLDGLAQPILPRTLQVSAKGINRILGMQIQADEMSRILNRLQIPNQLDGDSLTLQIPSFRQDITGQADVAEEILRLYGYDQIPTRLMTSQTAIGGRSVAQAQEGRLRDILCSLGYHEICNFSFLSPASYQKAGLPTDQCIRILNPLGEDTSLMRSSLIPGMLETLALNLSRKNPAAKLFEMAKVYRANGLPINDLPDEPLYCVVGIYGPNESFFSLKSDIQAWLDSLHLLVKYVPDTTVPYMHPGQCASILRDDHVIGVMGQLHPDIADAFDLNQRCYICHIDCQAVLSASLTQQLRFAPLPRYPLVMRDLACTVSTAQLAGPMLETISKAAGTLLEQASVFDVYKGKQVQAGHQSIAFSLGLRAPDHTLNDEEIQSVMDKILSALSQEHGAKIR